MNKQNPYPSPVPPTHITVLSELKNFKKHFDKGCMDDLEQSQKQDDFEFTDLVLHYKDKLISLPMHAQLYDDFIEFLNQQIDNE